MKPIIINMEDMSDSREVYESKPSKVIAIFIYVLCALLFIAFLWMYFSKMDIVVKSSGMIRPDESVGIVNNSYSGVIEKVNVQDGDIVKKDDVIYTIDQSELTVEEQYNQDQLDQLNEYMELTQKYKDSLLMNKNLFSKDKELEYYIKYENYVISLNTLKKKYKYENETNMCQQEFNEDQIAYYKDEIASMKLLVESIEGHSNKFSKGSNLDYYNKYLLYQSDYEALIEKYDDQEKQIKTSITKEQGKNSIDYYTDMIEQLELLYKSIENNKDYFKKKNTYQLQYKTYQKKKKKLEQAYDTAEKTYHANLELKDIAVSAWEVEESRIAKENAYDAIENYKDTTITECMKLLNEAKEKLKELKLSDNNSISKSDLLSDNQKSKTEALNSYKLKYIVDLQDKIKASKESLKTLEDKQQGLVLSEDQEYVHKESDSNAKKNKKKYGEVASLENNELTSTIQEITTYKNKIREVETNLKKIRKTMDSCIVKAKWDGTVNMTIELVKGNTISAGTEVMSVLPKDRSKYKVQIFMKNSDIGKIKEGMTVKFNVYAYPNTDYGYLTGKITKVSNDIKVDSQSGMAYYLVESTLNTGGFFKKDGTQAEIKAGMNCEAKVITDKKRVLTYVLEKLELLVKN